MDDFNNNRPNGSMYGESFDPADIQSSRTVSILAYIPFLFFLPLAAAPNSRFGRFHANQGLVLTLVWAIGTTVLRIIPFLGHPLARIYSIPMFLLVVLGMLRASGGRSLPLPIIGGVRIIR